MEERFISVEEAAKLLLVNKRQVSQMIKSGKLRARDVNASGNQRHIWRVWLPDVMSFSNPTSLPTETVEQTES